jgi:transcription-repair coupling factor (superfamily II helicase)
MRDLEIRGAGNILGTAQSGHILAVGFDLYCKMLKRSVATIKGDKTPAAASALVRLDFVSTNEAEFAAGPADRIPAFLPAGYIADARARIEACRKLADAPGSAALDALAAEWRDRYGPPPPAAAHLLTLQQIRLTAAGKRIQSVEVRENKLMIQNRGGYVLFAGKFPRLTSPDPEIKLREVLAFLEKRTLS